jgi:HEAT repeat protein
MDQESASLFELLASPEVEARQLALTELSEVLDERALPALLVAATDRDATVRRLAIELLGSRASQPCAGG